MKILLRHVFYTGSRSWRFHQFDRNLISSVISQIVIDTGNSDMRLGNRTHERHRNKQSFLEDDPRSWLHQRRSSIDFRPSESSFPNARSTRLLTRVLIPIKDEQQSLASTCYSRVSRVRYKIWVDCSINYPIGDEQNINLAIIILSFPISILCLLKDPGKKKKKITRKLYS